MKKKSNYLICMAGLCAVAALFLISSTDLILKEHAEPIYNVSVICSETSDETLANFKKGVEQSFSEWTADVSYVTLYDKNDVQQQTELILREIENGADAIVLLPLDSAALAEFFSEQTFATPVICANADVQSDKVIAYIHGDHESRGRGLLEKIAQDMAGSTGTVYTVATAQERGDVKALRGVIEPGLKEKGIAVRSIDYEDGEELSDRILETYRKDRQAVFLAYDACAMEEILKYANETILKNCGLYGAGFTNRILAGLDEGVVNAIAVSNDFDIGYLSFHAAREYLSGGRAAPELIVDGFLVTKETIYNRAYEKILFPVE